MLLVFKTVKLYNLFLKYCQFSKTLKWNELCVIFENLQFSVWKKVKRKGNLLIYDT